MTVSANVKSVKADLRTMGKKVLLVEGPDDWHALSHLIHTMTGAFPDYELGYCGNDDGVLDLLSGLTQASRQTQTLVGAILDADQGNKETDTDSGVQARIRSLKGRIGKYYEVPDALPEGGMILLPTEELDRDRLPILGVWLMPDNVRDGIFEDLLKGSMAPESEKYISTVVDKATNDGMTGFRAVERSKAIVKTHIAWQDPNKKNIGEAIGAHFNNLDPACRPFLDWLDRLFGKNE